MEGLVPHTSLGDLGLRVEETLNPRTYTLMPLARSLALTPARLPL